jgi:hypothetical protein
MTDPRTCNAQLDVTPTEIVEALDLIADYYQPDFGQWVYRAFDAITDSRPANGIEDVRFAPRNLAVSVSLAGLESVTRRSSRAGCRGRSSSGP